MIKFDVPNRWSAEMLIDNVKNGKGYGSIEIQDCLNQAQAAIAKAIK